MFLKNSLKNNNVLKKKRIDKLILYSYNLILKFTNIEFKITKYLTNNTLI